MQVLEVSDRSCGQIKSVGWVCGGRGAAALGSGRTCRKTEMRYETEHGTLKEMERSVPTEAGATHRKD